MKLSRKRSVTFQNSTLADTTPASMRAQRGPQKAIGTSESLDIQPVTDEQRRQAEWVLSLAGVPTMLTKKRFEVEMIFSGGGYEGTTMFAESLTQAIESAISSRSKYSVVGLARVKELRTNADRGFQLINAERIE